VAGRGSGSGGRWRRQSAAAIGGVRRHSGGQRRRPSSVAVGGAGRRHVL